MLYARRGVLFTFRLCYPWLASLSQNTPGYRHTPNQTADEDGFIGFRNVTAIDILVSVLSAYEHSGQQFRHPKSGADYPPKRWSLRFLDSQSVVECVHQT